MSKPKLLMICGVPGAGKSTFCDLLATVHDYSNIDVDNYTDGMIPLLERKDPSAVVEHLHAREPVVVDWGFPLSFIDLIEGLIARGVSAWWFDGDREITAARYRQARGSTPESEVALQQQLVAIDAAWPAIDRVFSGRMISVLDNQLHDRTPETLWSEIQERS